MCKYCENMSDYLWDYGDGLHHYKIGPAMGILEEEDMFLIYDGKWYIGVYDPERNPFATILDDTISYCPWCGRKLEFSDDEVEFSAEDEIARLEGRINHTNKMLRYLVENMQAIGLSDNNDLRRQAIRNLENLKGKI